MDRGRCFWQYWWKEYSWCFQRYTKNIKENDPFLDFNIPTDLIIEDLFHNSGDSDNGDNKVTIEDVSDDEDITDDIEPKLMIAETAKEPSIISGNQSVAIDSGPSQSKKYITSRFNSAVAAANKIKNKYKKRHKIIGKIKPKFEIKDSNDRPNKKVQIPNVSKAPKDWPKAAGYLDTKDQDSIRYV